nr:immune inhibitor A [bacterium]
YAQVSGDGGAWTNVGTYTGLQSAWTQIEVDLSAYAGQSVRVRFELDTDYSVIEDGWYIDDVMIEGVGSTNALPPAPALLGPLPGGEVQPTTNLYCGTVTDPEGDDVTYGFRVYDDPELTSVVFATQDIAAIGAQAQAEVTGLTDGVTYWWRAFAADSIEWGLMGDTRSFVVNDATDVDGVILGFDLRQLVRTGGENVRLALDLPRAGDLTVTVFNARGQAVRTLASGDRAAGSHLLTWDGRDASGRSAASGVYFVKARTGHESAVARVLMVR